MAQRTVAILLALPLAVVATSLAGAATKNGAPKHAPAASTTAPGAHATRGARPKFRPSRTAAAAEARRLGAAVGQGCNGRADMARNEHQWVVLCSNGKTYLVETPDGPHAGAPALECSLAGTGPQPACFGE